MRTSPGDEKMGNEKSKYRMGHVRCGAPLVQDVRRIIDSYDGIKSCNPNKITGTQEFYVRFRYDKDVGLFNLKRKLSELGIEHVNIQYA